MEKTLRFNYTETWIINGKSRDGFSTLTLLIQVPLPLTIPGRLKTNKNQTDMAKLHKADIVVYLNRDRDSRICTNFGPG